MKVVIVDPNSDSLHYAYSLCQALSQENVNVELVTKYDYEWMGKKKDFSVKNMFFKISTWLIYEFAFFNHQRSRQVMKGLEYVVDYLFFIRHCLGTKPDIIHFQWFLIPLADAIYLKVLKRLGFRIVYTAHNILPHEETKNDKKKYERVYNTVDRIIMHSHNNKVELLDLLTVESSKIKIIPHGGYDDFKIIERMSKEDARNRLNMSKAGETILFFGIIREYKGLQYLIKSLKIVKEKFPQVKLVIAGKPAVDFWKHFKLIDDLSLGESISLHLQFIPTKDVPLYFYASDLVVLPYIKTYQSGIVFMAYTFKRPVVVTKTGGLPEVVEDGKSGYVVPPRDENLLAEAIIKILKNKKLAKRMGDYGAQIAKTKHSWSLIAERTMRLYQNLLTEGEKVNK